MSFCFIIKAPSRCSGFLSVILVSSFYCLLWIGGQFPVDNFLSYGHILTLHFWFILAFVSLTHHISSHLLHSIVVSCVPPSSFSISMGESARRCTSHSLIFISFVFLTLLISSEQSG